MAKDIEEVLKDPEVQALLAEHQDKMVQTVIIIRLALKATWLAWDDEMVKLQAAFVARQYNAYIEAGLPPSAAIAMITKYIDEKRDDLKKALNEEFGSTQS